MTNVDGPKIWQRATRCESRECVEVAFGNGRVFVRNSQDPDGGILTFSSEEWHAFCAGVRMGELRG